MNKNIFYVYTLAYPDGKVFYVGKGQGNRVLAHLAEARAGTQSKKCDAIRSIWQTGQDVRITKVQEHLSESEAFEAERLLMESYENLTNTGKAGLGRPSQGRSIRLQATLTPTLATWLETQKSGDSLSDVVYRLLDGIRQADIQQSS